MTSTKPQYTPNTTKLPCSRDVRPVKASQMLSPKSVYHYAAQVGAKASTVLECAEVFDLCPLDRVGIMDTYAQFAAAPVSP